MRPEECPNYRRWCGDPERDTTVPPDYVPEYWPESLHIKILRPEFPWRHRVYESWNDPDTGQKMGRWTFAPGYPPPNVRCVDRSQP